MNFDYKMMIMHLTTNQTNQPNLRVSNQTSTQLLWYLSTYQQCKHDQYVIDACINHILTMLADNTAFESRSHCIQYTLRMAMNHILM